MRMSSTNILILKIRTSPTWERHQDSFSNESKTTKGQTKTVLYSSTSTIANPAKVQTFMTILKFLSDVNLHLFINLWKIFTNKVQDIDVSPNGGLGVSCSTDGTMCVWETSNGVIRVITMVTYGY